jgi:hypothetical protein
LLLHALRQAVPAALQRKGAQSSNTGAAQESFWPSQRTSDRAWSPLASETQSAALQTVLDPSRRSAGQSMLMPSQISVTSQPFCVSGRQTNAREAAKGVTSQPFCALQLYSPQHPGSERSPAHSLGKQRLSSAVPGVQAPAPSHVSSTVQSIASAHAVPLGKSFGRQSPPAQVSCPEHWVSTSPHAVPSGWSFATHTPLAQVSGSEHSVASSPHSVPSGRSFATHTPLAQVSGSEHSVASSPHSVPSSGADSQI